MERKQADASGHLKITVIRSQESQFVIGDLLCKQINALVADGREE